jgi:hypothetical protein
MPLHVGIGEEDKMIISVTLSDIGFSQLLAVSRKCGDAVTIKEMKIIFSEMRNALANAIAEVESRDEIGCERFDGRLTQQEKEKNLGVGLIKGAESSWRNFG